MFDNKDEREDSYRALDALYELSVSTTKVKSRQALIKNLDIWIATTRYSLVKQMRRRHNNKTNIDSP